MNVQQHILQNHQKPQETQEKQFKNNPLSFNSTLARFPEFPKIETKLYLIFPILTKIVIVISMVIAILPEDKKEQIDNQYQNLMGNLFVVLIVTNMVGKLLVIISIYGIYHSTQSQKIDFVTRSARLIFNWIHFIIQIDLMISFLVNFNRNSPITLVNLTVSSFIYISSNVYLTEYFNKGYFLHISSCFLNLIYRIFIVLGFIFGFILKNNFLNTVYTFIFVCWFISYGHAIYSHDILKQITIFFISLLTCTSILTITQIFSTSTLTIPSFFIQLGLSFGISYLFLSTSTKYHITNQKDLQDYFFRINVLQNEIIHQQSYEIYGHIYLWKLRNQNRQILQKDKKFDPEKYIRNFQKHFFQEQLTKRQTKELLLKYCCFLLQDRNEIFNILLITNRIKKYQLRFCDQIILEKINKQLRNRSKQLAEQLYDGQLNIENVIEFEDIFNNVTQNLFKIIQQNIDNFSLLKNSILDFNQLMANIKQNIRNEAFLEQQWKRLQKYFRLHKYISFIYHFFKIYIKNEQVNFREYSQQFKYPIKNITDQQHIYINQQDDPIKKQCLLHKQTIIINCYSYLDKTLIKNCNKNIHLLEYTKQQILQEQIQIIMTDQTSKDHQMLLQTWMNQCQMNNPKSYPIVRTEVRSKSNLILPIIKYFKLFINHQTELELICMLKINLFNQIHQQILSRKTQNHITSFQKPQSQFENIFQKQKAIFVKSEQYVPVKMINQVERIKTISIILLILLVASSCLYYLVIDVFFQQLISYSSQYTLFMQCYRIPMVLGNAYLKSIQNIGNQTQVQGQIKSLSLSYQSLLSNKVILKTLYDTTINTPAKYSAFQSNNPVLNNYDQIDVFYQIYSSISSLKYPINKNQKDFISFNQFLIPAYDNILNNTKHVFYSKFQYYINRLQNFNIYFSSIQMVSIGLVLFGYIYIIRQYFKKLQRISLALTYLREEKLDIIIIYWKTNQSILLQFLNKNPQELKLSSRKQNKQMTKSQKIEQQNLNRRAKEIIPYNKYSTFKIKIIIMTILAIFFIGALFGWFELDQFNDLQTISSYVEQGNMFLKYFPVATLVGYGCLEKNWSLNDPSVNFSSKRYQQALSTMYLVGQFSYHGKINDPSSLYEQKLKNYFFGNPCQYNPSVLVGSAINTSKCETIINGSFKQGLASYMRAGHNIAQPYINGQTILSPAQLAQFSLSVSVLSGYILDAITTWGTEFNTRITNIMGQRKNQLIVNFVIVIIGSFFLLMIVRSLKAQYEFHRYIFMKMIPELFLEQEKVIRQNFINDAILQ